MGRAKWKPDLPQWDTSPAYYYKFFMKSLFKKKQNSKVARHGNACLSLQSWETEAEAHEPKSKLDYTVDTVWKQNTTRANWPAAQTCWPEFDPWNLHWGRKKE